MKRIKGEGNCMKYVEPSFDWKECRSDKFIDQKLEYIHANPCLLEYGIWLKKNISTSIVRQSITKQESKEYTS